MEYLIRQHGLEEGALEIQYIEEWFGEFRRRKTAAEITRRLCDRDHIILMAEAPLPDDPSQVVPVAFKVGHEIPFELYQSVAEILAYVYRLKGRNPLRNRKKPAAAAAKPQQQPAPQR